MREIFKRRGPIEILETLQKFTGPVSVKAFLHEFQREKNRSGNDRYYSLYDRGKGILLEYQLIAIQPDERGDNLISLTERGKHFFLKYREMVDILYGD